MMISSEKLKQLSKSEIENCDKGQLVDITTVKLNPSDSVEKRLDSYFQQIKNPYLFKVGDIAVKLEFAGGKSFEELLASLLCSS